MLSLILTLVCLLIQSELDLLAFLLLATYASVFIALALLSLHFGPFWLRASGGVTGVLGLPLNAGVALGLCGGVLVNVALAGPTIGGAH